MVYTLGILRLRDDEENQWYDFELRALTYLRPASEQELAGALGSPIRRMKDKLLPSPESSDPTPNISLKALKLSDDKEDFDTKVERSRVLAGQYLAALPNFNADDAGVRHGF
jgi:hypothetical protein